MCKKVYVVESNISINGEHIIVAIAKNYEKLTIGTILAISEGKQWRIMNNELQFSGKSFLKLIKEKENEGIFFYDLQGIGHQDMLQVGQELMVIET